MPRLSYDRLRLSYPIRSLGMEYTGFRMYSPRFCPGKVDHIAEMTIYLKKFSTFIYYGILDQLPNCCWLLPKPGLKDTVIWLDRVAFEVATRECCRREFRGCPCNDHNKTLLNKRIIQLRNVAVKLHIRISETCKMLGFSLSPAL